VYVHVHTCVYMCVCDCDNWRGISLLDVVGKVMGQVIQE